MEPGRWRTETAEYQRGLMDSLTDPRVEKVVLMTSARVGKTQACVNNLVGYHMHMDPGNIMVVLPSETRADEWAEDELDPMIRDTPTLRAIAGDRKGRSNKDRRKHRAFPGGRLYVVGANAPSALAAKTIRILCCDEIDRFPASAGNEGDVVSLAIRRTNTAWNRKIILSSTPTIAGQSRIEKAFEESDQRRYWVPCHACQYMQVLRWAQVKWDRGNTKSARYICEECGEPWSDAQRWAAIRHGEWRAAAEFRGTAGFHINELYSSWRKLSETAADFEVAQKGGAEFLKPWINTALGETWQQKGEAPEWRRLYDRREDYEPGVVPRDGLVLTAGLDVQKDRVEIYVWAWGADRQCWLVDFIVIQGNPFNRDVWDRASEAVQQTWRHEGGAEMRLMKVGADTGFATTQVEAWARRHPALVIPVKGATTLGAPVFAWSGVRDTTAGGKRAKRGLRLGMVGGHLATMELYGFLALDPPTDEQQADGIAYPPGYVHLNGLASEEVCKQLVGDQWIEEKGAWKAVHAREALDAWKYSRAVLSAMGVDRWAPSRWKALRAAVTGSGGKAEDPAPAPDPESHPPFEPGRPIPAHLMPARQTLRPAVRSRWMD